jgi:hypothetical protein
MVRFESIDDIYDTYDITSRRVQGYAEAMAKGEEGGRHQHPGCPSRRWVV